MNDPNAVAIVLVEPQNPGNVGMVCRAMKNMGLSKLRLVNPCQTDHPEALKFAVSARDLLESASRFSTLREALSDSPFSVATTRRHGKYRQEIFTPEEIAAKIRGAEGGGGVALVFGREDSGLTTDEVALCRWYATIPTDDLETLYDHMERSLLHIGYLNPQNPGHIMRSLRRIFARAELDSREVAVLRGLMAQIDWAAGGFTGKKKS